MEVRNMANTLLNNMGDAVILSRMMKVGSFWLIMPYVI